MCLHHFFEKSCDERPNVIALICGNECLRYAELDERANRLAHHLIRLGVQPGDRVGLFLERSVDMYTTLLAILKAGAAFVPLDPSFPPYRVAFIADDASLRLLVTAGPLAAAAAAATCPVLILDQANDAIASEAATRPQFSQALDALGYIIYTSGTTGRPKGVAIHQSSICPFISACASIYGVRANDRVYQGMTLAFDFSIEEIWPTFAAGATLIAGPNDHGRFGEGLNEFLIQQEISVLCCVPTLLATLERDVPSLRLLLVGGEACPPELVERWHRPGRRILNTYGPTEATVTASWGELSPDRPVTIGRPMPGTTIHILDEALRPVPAGSEGEICIGGVGVAVGYVNRPEQTAERFVPDVFAEKHGARLYRTGDLGRITPDGEIEFLGRIDSQIKIRGYRIELDEIEAVLREDAAVANAVVALVTGDGGVAELAAYVVLRGPFDFDELRERLLARVHCRLPAYMTPAFLEAIDALPMLPSQKVDRAHLPRPRRPRIADAAGSAETSPQTPLEQMIAVSWSRVFGHEIRSVHADFFLDLGGHSLFAALAASDLRQQPELRHLAIGDIYTHRTVHGLAQHLAPRTAQGTSHPGASLADETPSERLRHGSRRVLAAGAAQMSLLYVALIPWLAPTLALVLLLTSESLSPLQMVAGMAAAIVAIPLIALFLPVAAKWLLLGRVRPGRHPLWGWFFCRWWLVRKLMQTAPLDLLAGSPLLALYLRLLGARIGPGCHLGSAHLGLPDLIDIGEGACLGYGVELEPSHVEAGWLHLKPIRIGAGAYVGANASIQGGSNVVRAARIAEQSLVANGQTIPAGETWAGSPSQRTDADPQLDSLYATQPAARWPAWALAGFVVAALVLLVLPTLLLAPGLLLIWGVSGGDLWLGLALTPAAGLLHVLGVCAVVVAGKWATLPATRPGIYPLRSGFGLRKWFADRLMLLSLTLTNSLYATLYLIPFLRLLGTRIGPRAEVSTVSNIDPDLLTLGAECFVADLAVIGAARVCNGCMVLGETEIGERGFVGNAALVPGDTKLPRDSLLGVLSVPPNHPVEPGSSWLGSPALFLPRRQSSGTFDEALTYRPPARLVACRLAIEFLRVILPATLGFVALFSSALVLLDMLEEISWPLAALLLPAVYLASGLLVTVATAALKWLVVQRYRPRVEPQWSQFVWRTELITALYENVAVPWLIHWLAGTPLMAPALRLFGAHVGRRVYMETTFLTEFDLVHVGDDAAIGESTALQTHLFEDRVMKMSTVTIGPRCTIGSRAVVLYDAELAAEAHLGALSLVMKGESLPAGGLWSGIPAETVN